MRRMFTEDQLAEIIGKEGYKGLSDKDVVVKSLEVSSADEFEIDVSSGLGDRTLVKRYAKCLVSGGILYLIFSVQFKNETENTISASNVRFSVTIPPKYGEHIITISGGTLADDGPLDSICSFEVKRGNTFSSAINSYLFKDSKNKMSFNLNVAQLTAGASEQYEGRIFLCLF